MSKRQSTSKKTTEHPLMFKDIGEAGEIDPITQVGNTESSGLAETIESSGLAETIESSGLAETIESSGLAETIESSGLAETIESSGLAETIELSGLAETIVSSGQARIMDPSGQARIMDPSGQARTMDPSGQARTMDPSGQARTMDPSGQARTMDPSGQARTMDPSGQTRTIYSSGQARTMDSSRQARTMDPSGQARTIVPSGQAVTMEPKRQAKTIQPKEQHGTIEHKEKDKNVRWKEQAGGSRSTKQTGSSKYKRQTGKTRSLSDQANSKDCASPAENLNLSNFVDVQRLFHIGYRNPELLPLIKRISVVGEIMRNFNLQVQNELIALIKVVERTIKEFVYMKNTSYNSDAVEETTYRLLPNLSRTFSRVVLKHGYFILDPAVRNLVEWKKISKKLSKKKRRICGVNLFDLSTHFQANDLIKIGRDHPEFRANIKTILGVNTAMKHLNHEGQVEIYRILRRIEKIIKDLVQEKTNPDGCHDIFLTPETLSSSLDYCIEKVLMHLKANQKIPIECSQCEMDRSYVMDIDIKPDLGTLKRPRTRTKPKVNPPLQQQSVFDCANWGISPDCVKNLESLIHHLTARKGAFIHVWSLKNCIDWFEIASLFAGYRSKTRQDMAGIRTLKFEISQNLDRVEEVMTGARDFCARMRVYEFTRNETLSDVIALSGEMEMLASEVEYYISMLGLLIKVIFGYMKSYVTLTTRIQDNRILFLTKSQWRAFDFPFY